MSEQKQTGLKPAGQKQIGFKLPQEQYDKFEKELKKTGMSISSMMKLFISEWLYKRGVK